MATPACKIFPFWYLSVFALWNLLSYRHLACEEDRADVAKFLVKNNARLDILNKEEQNPLSIAPKGLATTLQRLNDMHLR